MVKLDEKTKVSISVHNLWAILASFVLTAFTVGIAFSNIQTKMDNILTNQIELKQDFKSWKTQAESRLGEAEIKIAVLDEKIIRLK